MNPRKHRAFTLIEMLLSMIILALGLISIAAFFPVASYLQRTSLEESMALQAARSATAMLEARGLDRTYLPGTKDQVTAIPSALSADWPLGMRAYPSFDATADASDADALQRDFYWVPLVMNSNEGNKAFVFILRRRVDEEYHQGDANPDDGESGGSYFVPSVTSASASRSDDKNITASIEVSAGDPILDNLGNVYQVTTVDGNKLTVNGKVPSTGLNTVWYSRAPKSGGAGSPCRRIMVLGEEAFE